MPFRWTHIRTVDPSIPHDRRVRQPFSLWWAALAAADETMQGGPLVPAWLRLFSAHLSMIDAVRLRWGGDLGESAELRRAYSALYGRYFARALLASRLGLTDFVSLRTDVTRLPNGIRIQRIAKGDIPDWIAWDPIAGAYCLCEAKGSLTGKQAAFMTGHPTCVTEGKKQFGRVQVVDRAGVPLATRDWVAANLWSTDSRPRESVSLLWDPPGDGMAIPESQREEHADGLRRRRVANIALRLGRPGLIGSARRLDGALIRVVAQPDRESMPYMPGAGEEDEALRPIVDAADVTALKATQGSETPAMLFGLSTDALRADQSFREPWLAGEGIAGPDGLSLFDFSRIKIDG